MNQKKLKRFARVSMTLAAGAFLFTNSVNAFAASGHQLDENGQLSQEMVDGTLSTSSTPDGNSGFGTSAGKNDRPFDGAGAIANTEFNGTDGLSLGQSDIGIEVIEPVLPLDPGPGGGREEPSNKPGSGNVSNNNERLPQTNEAREGYLIILGILMLGTAVVLKQKQRRLSRIRM